MSKFSVKRAAVVLGFQYLLLFSAAIIIWRICFPGLMSPDSIGQIAQAHQGIFNDANPPLMSVVLWLVMKLGGSVSTLIFIQCVAALFGLRSIISLSIQFFSDRFVSEQTAGLVAAFVTVLFLIPFLTPFMFFSVIFWKDAWLAIMLLWITSYLLWLFLNVEAMSRRSIVIHVLLLSLAATPIVAVRHNAVVITPVIAVAAAVLCRRKLGRIGLVFGGLTLLLALALNPVMNSVFSINRLYFGNTVLASDLKVMLKLFPELQAEYPLAARHQDSPIFLDAKEGGTWDQSTEGKPCPTMECDKMPQECYGTTANTKNIDGSNCYMPFGNDNLVLKNEYVKAVKTHPYQFAYTKIYLYLQILHPRNWQAQKVAYDVYDNPYGLKINKEYGWLRLGLAKLSLETGNRWYFIWVSGIHIIWLILNVLGAIYCSAMIFIKRDRKMLFTLLLFLIPLSYYFSYVIAATTPDYRFLYPSTLIMQALIVSLLSAKILRFFNETERRCLTGRFRGGDYYGSRAADCENAFGRTSADDFGALDRRTCFRKIRRGGSIHILLLK